MDELSPLFQEIEFHERYRGYDPDEVDAFVDRVARAAAVMRGRISELHERIEAAEARAGGVGGHSDTEETLTRTLVLAQRTADAAIAEAREEADRLTADAAAGAQAILSAAEAEAAATVDDAADRAGRILAEAETDRRTMVAEAESLASHAAAVERERLAAEVTELHEYRAFLADDVEILERHLAEERRRLMASLAALTDLIDSPEVFRSTRPPATSGVEVDVAQLAAIVEPEEAGESSEVDEPEEVAQPVDDIDAVGDDLGAVAADVAPSFEPADEPLTIDLVAAEAEATAVDEPVATGFDLDEPDQDPESGPGSTSTEPDPPGRAAPAPAGMSDHALVVTPASRRLVTAADLEPAAVPRGRVDHESSTLDRSADDGGPVTEAMPIISEGSLFTEPDTDDDPFLAQLRDAVGVEPMPDERDDEALSAFFDQEDDDSSRSWFGRRR